jgi:hypothetical protein
MAFTKKYKSLGDVVLAYRLTYKKEHLRLTQKVKISQSWLEEFEFDLQEVPYDASEASIREVLIYPILRLAWKPYSDYFTLWGHKAIEADDVLSGIPDYIIAKKSELGRIVFEKPYVAVVEAKMDDFIEGWAQCCLEMLAIQKINDDPNLPVFGIVTNGEIWQFGKLDKDIFTKFEQSFTLDDKEETASALATVLDFYKTQVEIISSK